MSRYAAAALLLAFAAIGCTSQVAVNSVSDRSAIEALLRRWPQALAAYDYRTASAMGDSSAVWIEQGPPISFAAAVEAFRPYDSAKVVIKYSDLRDLQIGIQGDVAWAHWVSDGTFTTDTDAGRAYLRKEAGTTDPNQREWHFSWVESAVMRRSDGQWRFVLGHTTCLAGGPRCGGVTD